MDDTRKSPEEILARIKEEEVNQTRGRLKIFLGATAGVGKTFTMLQDARNLKKDGVDVVGGVVVTHGRKETEELLEGLELIPEQVIEYKSVKLKEFDLDAALARKPEVILVDELAHTNVPGTRHEKRWQDVEELLQAGIDVQTTVNVQHLESLNDLVAQITGIVVSETIPDLILEKANEIELVDLPPDELIQRLHEGKVYLPETVNSALDNFFKKGNLIALREMALRITAERVDAEMLRYRHDKSVSDVWPVSGRILVCVGPSPLSVRLVRATKRMAVNLRAEWIAAYVENPDGSTRLSEKDRERVNRTLRLAERLGGRAARLSSQNAADELVKYAQLVNASHIVIGKPARPRWREILFGSVVDDLIRRSGNIDVYVITGDKKETEEVTSFRDRDSKIFWSHYLFSATLVGLTTALSRLLLHHLELVNLVMPYLLVVVLVAVKFGRGPAVVATVLGVACFDFFLVPPYLTFAVSDTQYIITFMVMLVVGLTVSSLTSAVKQQAVLARMRERQTAALYAMTREQATAVSTAQVVDKSLKHIAEISDSQLVLFLSDNDNKLVRVTSPPPSFVIDTKELGVAQWVFINQQQAGKTTATLSGAKALYVPLIGSKGAIGVIGVLPRSSDKFSNPEEMHLLDTCINQTALAVERAQLSERRQT